MVSLLAASTRIGAGSAGCSGAEAAHRPERGRPRPLSATDPSVGSSSESQRCRHKRTGSLVKGLLTNDDAPTRSSRRRECCGAWPATPNTRSARAPQSRYGVGKIDHRRRQHRHGRRKFSARATPASSPPIDAPKCGGGQSAAPPAAKVSTSTSKSEIADTTLARIARSRRMALPAPVGHRHREAAVARSRTVSEIFSICSRGR